MASRVRSSKGGDPTMRWTITYSPSSMEFQTTSPSQQPSAFCKAASRASERSSVLGAGEAWISVTVTSWRDDRRELNRKTGRQEERYYINLIFLSSCLPV